MHRYEESYQQITETNKSSKTAIKKLIEFLLQDISKGPTSNIWHVAWALSDHDDELAKFVDDWYHRYLQTLSNLFRQLIPGLTPSKANRAAVILTALIDGLTIQISENHKISDIHGNVKRSVSQVLAFLLEK